MNPKIRYINFFEPESVCIGDLLRNKANKDIYYVVIWINVEGEEWYCIEIGREGSLTELIQYIGFEHVEEFSKGEVESLIFD